MSINPHLEASRSAPAAESPTTAVCADLVSRADLDRMPLIDIHCHGSFTQENLPTLTELIALERRERLSFVLMIIEDQPAQVASVRENRDLVGALLWVDPRKEGYLQDVERFTRENRDILRGYKLHPTITGFDIRRDLLDGLFALANREDLLIVTHTDSGRSPAGQFHSLLEKHPLTKMILYHASPAEEAFALVNEFANVFIDVSFLAWGKQFQQNALCSVGKEKILFGIDSPLGFEMKGGVALPHYRDAAAEVAAFYDNDRDIAEHVLYRNAARLLDLSTDELAVL